MPRYAAFLRGINVTGTRIKSADLCAPFMSLGLENVTTFRASGNVIFDGPRRSPASLAADVERALAADLGLTRAVTFVRTAAEIRALAATDPFPGAEGKTQVVFLGKPPAAAARKEMLALATNSDRLEFGKRELFWLPAGGVARSDLGDQAFGRLLGVTTTRTKATIDGIAAKFFG